MTPQKWFSIELADMQSLKETCIIVVIKFCFCNEVAERMLEKLATYKGKLNKNGFRKLQEASGTLFHNKVLLSSRKAIGGYIVLKLFFIISHT